MQCIIFLVHQTEHCIKNLIITNTNITNTPCFALFLYTLSNDPLVSLSTLFQLKIPRSLSPYYLITFMYIFNFHKYINISDQILFSKLFLYFILLKHFVRNSWFLLSRLPKLLVSHSTCFALKNSVSFKSKISLTCHHKGVPSFFYSLFKTLNV